MLFCPFKDENKNCIKWCYPPSFAKNLTLVPIVRLLPVLCPSAVGASSPVVLPCAACAVAAAADLVLSTAASVGSHLPLAMLMPIPGCDTRVPDGLVPALLGDCGGSGSAPLAVFSGDLVAGGPG